MKKKIDSKDTGDESQAFRFVLSPQASTYRTPPSGWRETLHGSVYYRVFADGGFEVMGKIQDPDALNEAFRCLPALIISERDLIRQKRPGRGRRSGRAEQSTEAGGLFAGGKKTLAVHLEKIPVL